MAKMNTPIATFDQAYFERVIREQAERVRALETAVQLKDELIQAANDRAETAGQDAAEMVRLKEAELLVANERNSGLSFDLNLFAAALGVQGRDDVDAAVTRLNIRIAEIERGNRELEAERDLAIEAARDCFSLLPPERVRLVRPRSIAVLRAAIEAEEALRDQPARGQAK